MSGDNKVMSKKIFRSFLAMGALATACATWGCVADRPARNGVFNENQYIRKDFLIRSGATGSVDPGWIFRSTILATSAMSDQPACHRSGTLVIAIPPSALSEKRPSFSLLAL